MPVSFEQVHIGERYTRPQLADLWEYEGYEAISRGIVTPAGTRFIILFITREKQACHPQYEDVLDGRVLNIQGETNHAADRRLVDAAVNGDETHLFYRERHHAPFRYEGRLRLQSHQVFTDQPSRFTFALPEP
jgi:putative restriction endonuclease